MHTTSSAWILTCFWTFGHLVIPGAACDDLTIYLRHLRNADQMVSRLRLMLEQCERPASLCWFGDHVPIMPVVYEIFGAPPGEVEYVFWVKQGAGSPEARKTHAHDLALDWLRIAHNLHSDAVRFWSTRSR